MPEPPLRTTVRSPSWSAAPSVRFGAKIGRAIDDSDRGCMGHALEPAGDKATVRWTNSAGVRYELTPTRNLGGKASLCREVITKMAVG